jgi:hypothetical protein
MLKGIHLRGFILMGLAHPFLIKKPEAAWVGVVLLSPHPLPVTDLIQVLTVAATGGHMTPLSLAVDVLTTAQGLIHLRPPIGSLLHDGQPRSQSPPGISTVMGAWRIATALLKRNGHLLHKNIHCIQETRV